MLLHVCNCEQQCMCFLLSTLVRAEGRLAAYANQVTILNPFQFLTTCKVTLDSYFRTMPFFLTHWKARLTLLCNFHVILRITCKNTNKKKKERESRTKNTKDYFVKRFLTLEFKKLEELLDNFIHVYNVLGLSLSHQLLFGPHSHWVSTFLLNRLPFPSRFVWPTEFNNDCLHYSMGRG